MDDKDLQEVLYANGLFGNYEQFSYTLADNLLDKSPSLDSFIKNNSLSAEEYYRREYENYRKNSSYVSQYLTRIQDTIYDVYGKLYVWNQPRNEGLYVAILKSILYGSIKHFFYENRDKYLPQYDWYLINNNPKRKDIIDMLFKEFDKLAEISRALQYYQDADDIPLEFIIYLQEIVGLTVNDYNGIFTEKQLRSLTKHLIEVWREKGSMFSIELFFMCMGIQCSVSELWFDQRLYDNPENYNDYTKVNSKRSFGYYLTTEKPHTVSYEFSPESVNYTMYTEPKSSRIWEYKVDRSEGVEEVLKLLGREPGEDITYTYFKSNFILITFSYLSINKSVSKDELEVYKELVDYMLPVFVRTYYGNEYESSFGNDDWDILNARDNATEVDDIKSGSTRPATPLGLVDTQLLNFGTDLNPLYTFDAYSPDLVGTKFVSGSYIVVNDIRFSQFITDNGYVLSITGDIPKDTVFYGTFHRYKAADDNKVFIIGEDETVLYNVVEDNGKFYVKLPLKDDWAVPVYIDNDDMNSLLTSPEYDMVGGRALSYDFYNEYPIFYNDEHEYKYGYSLTEDTEIDPEKTYFFYDERNDSYMKVFNPVAEDISDYYELDRTKLICDDGTKGELKAETSSDITDIINVDTLTKYYFKVNNSETRIYPNLFVDNNNGGLIAVQEGNYYDETFNPILEPQINWTYDIEETQEVEELPYEVFDQKYTENALNLFESSSYHDEAFAVNDLYNDDNSWNGNIQYEYCEYTNPLESVISKLDSDLNITLI